MSIDQWLAKATKTLADAGVASARLDCLVLLSDLFGADKSWLLSHKDEPIPTAQLTQLNVQLTRRARREPLAYIRGWQEFYGRDFIVTPDVLIPRPETEQLVTISRTLDMPEAARVLDVGCGSGCIGLSLALERPELDVTLSDISLPALAVAGRNAQRLQAKVELVQSDVLAAISGQRFSLIIANLPYVDHSWERSAETNHEPALALFANDNGCELIKQLIDQAPGHLAAGGYLLLEADPRQMNELSRAAETRGFAAVDQQPFALLLQSRLS